MKIPSVKSVGVDKAMNPAQFVATAWFPFVLIWRADEKPPLAGNCASVCCPLVPPALDTKANTPTGHEAGLLTSAAQMESAPETPPKFPF